MGSGDTKVVRDPRGENGVWGIDGRQRMHFRRMDTLVPASLLDAELLAHRTWPCRDEETYGEWILRAADGYSRRANSALAIGVPLEGIPAALDHVYAWFRAREVEPCVKITPLAPASLDEALEASGWTMATPSLVLRLDEPPVATGDVGDVEMVWSKVVEADWFERLSTWDEESTATAEHHRALLERMPDARFVAMLQDGRIAGVAVASLDGNHAHLYDVVVDPSLRGQGLGSSFLRQILSDLRREDVRDTTLQVLESNVVARSLYRKFGFVEVHRYHYRVALPCADVNPLPPDV